MFLWHVWRRQELPRGIEQDGDLPVVLLLNALLGWRWADPVAGLVMVPIIAPEGVDALRGRGCRTADGCGSATPWF